MANKSRKRLTVLIIIMVLLSVLKIFDYLFTTIYDPITTKVVDAETGEPIEGAVVMVEWTNKRGLGLTYTKTYKVEEVATDSEGIAKLEGIPPGKASLYIVAVYRKGYVLWSNHNVFAGSRMLTNFEWKDNYVFEMARFKPEYSYVKHSSFFSRVTSSGGYKIHEAFSWESEEASKERYKRGKK